MDPKFLAIGIVLTVGVFFGILDLFSKTKLRQLVRSQWGKTPRQTRLDKEESLKAAWQIEKQFHDWDSEIDDLTWYDLDMQAIFELINGTYSSIGSEALYQRLRNFHFNQTDDLEELIQFYQENPEIREKIQFHFAGLGKHDNNFTKQYIANGKKEKLGNLGLYVLLGLLPLISLILLVVIGPIGIFLLLGSILFNVIFYMTKKAKLETELESMRYLVQSISLANKLATIPTPRQAEIRENSIPLKSIAKWGFSFRVKSNSEADMLFEYLNLAFMIPFIAYNFVITRLSKYSQEAINLWSVLGEMEVAAAVLNFRTYFPISCQPEFAEGGIKAEDIYHPLVEYSVVNPVDWQRNTLVTGSNASGKSTYVKSIAISAILSQTINTAIAEQFTMQPGHVLTSMAVEDDILAGDSYFVAEIKSIKRLLSQVKKGARCYCFIDEILKGTNTIERIAASSSVVTWLADYPSLSFVATHDIELTEMLKKQCDNVHFEETVTEDRGITFDYVLKQGPSVTRNAIALLKVMDYPEKIVDQAQKEARYFDEQRTWPIVGSDEV
ncbi:MAG: MutS-related protein [Enterococcus avium]|uniref:MutS-related protein n=1 Tax=Enterococcus avium TaxID=33945 RepID=UPI00232F5AF6|nr:DNA mismatch repair protein MutS [Enterococcus avium]MDB1750681.1 DNA mismatch repair protein MutS [Enterococcus avium]MDB1754734.1 DNA mismatch repair protein MutS [Enterococcus avium]MDB1761823.1 DNA mismatch repair protein MutS [Enterococcus avium]